MHACCISQDTRKVDFPSTGKVWENTNISNLQEKYEKTQTFQIYGFLKYFGEVEIHNTPKTWGK